MSLAATHLHFAISIKNKYSPSDLSKYLSGAMYPDSRYVSGVERKLTHNPEIIDIAKNSNDDFLSGWATHLICDKINRSITNSNFAGIMLDAENNVDWIKATAIKVCQDMYVLSKFNVHEYLPYLNYVQSKFGENIDFLTKNNQIVIDLYSKEHLELNDYVGSFMALGISEEKAKQIVVQAEKFMQDTVLFDQIKNAYDKSVELSLI